MKRFFLGFLFICILVIGYGAWPAFSVYQIYSGAQSKDKALLERKVDWPSVRTSMRASIEEAVEKEIKKQSGNLSESAGFLASQASSELSKSVVTQILDTYITPEGFIKLVESGGQVDIGEFGVADKLRNLLDKKSQITGLVSGVEGLKENPLKEISGSGLLTGAFGNSKTEDNTETAKTEIVPKKEKVAKKEGPASQPGMDNVKLYGTLGFTNYNEYKFGVSKEPKAKEPDLIAVMAFENFDWKLKQIIPKIK